MTLRLFVLFALHFAPIAFDSIAPASPLENVLAGTPVAKADLLPMACEELDVVEHAIYARHGLVPRSAELREALAGATHQSPAPASTVGKRLTRSDILNRNAVHAAQDVGRCI